MTPSGLVDVWKKRYTEFWPKGSHLYQPPEGLETGDVAAADLAMIAGTRVATGIIVLNVDDTSFTFATLQGHTFCGTITFSGVEEDGATVARVDVIMRASDPIYEIGMPLAATSTRTSSGKPASMRWRGISASKPSRKWT